MPKIGRPRKDPDRLASDQQPLAMRLERGTMEAFAVLLEAMNLYSSSLGLPGSTSQSALARNLITQGLEIELLGEGRVPKEFIQAACSRRNVDPRALVAQLGKSGPQVARYGNLATQPKWAVHDSKPGPEWPAHTRPPSVPEVRSAKKRSR